MKRSFKLEKERGSGDRVPSGIVTSHPLQTVGKGGECLLSFVIYSKNFSKQAAKRKYNVHLNVICSCFKSKKAATKIWKTT